jgi:hypothetical protein
MKDLYLDDNNELNTVTKAGVDLKFSSDAWSVSRIIQNRIISTPSQFYDCLSIDKSQWVGMSNTIPTSNLIETYINNMFSDIKNVYSAVAIDCVVIPYDEGTMMIKIFISDSKQEVDITDQ